MNSIYMKKVSRVLTVSLTLVVVMVGCGDEVETSKQETIVSPAKIEVVANTNAKEIKVKEKSEAKGQSKSYYLDYNVKSAYDQNAQPANQDASVRVKPRTKIEANMHVRSPYEKIKTTILVSKLSKKFIVKCSACHNDYANGIIGPSLLDKDEQFIYKKISEFKEDKSKNILMYELVKQMSDEEIKDMSNEIYRFNQELKKIRSK